MEKTGPESAVALSEVTAYGPKNRHDFANSEKAKKYQNPKKMETQTSKCQVSKGYDPKNRHDFANSEKNFKMPGFERL